MVDVAVGNEDAGDEGMVFGAIGFDAVVIVLAEIENDRGLPFVAKDVGIGFLAPVIKCLNRWFHG